MRASVEMREWHMDTRVPSFPGVYGAIVIPSLRGEINTPTLITSETQLLSVFTPNNSIEIGFDSSYFSAAAFLAKSNKLWVVRAANNPLYGGCLMGQDPPLTSVGIFATYGNSSFTVKNTLAEDLKAAKIFFTFVATGEKVQLSVSDGGSLPTGLNTSAVYYFIGYKPDGYQFKLAYTKDDADNGVAIELSDNGMGDLTLNLVGSSGNSSLSSGVADPNSFIMDSSDGKVAGLSSEFAVDVQRDSFEVEQVFYDTVETGDTLMLSATEFPIADLGNPFNSTDSYYVIKLVDSLEIQLSRTASAAASGTFIPISTTGSEITGTLTNKAVVSPSVTANPATNNFVVSSGFFAAAQTGDRTLISAGPDGYPIVSDGGAVIDGDTDFYIIKGISLQVQIARSEADAKNGIAVQFNTSGTQLSMALPDKSITSSLSADLSNDTLSVSPTFYEWIEDGNKVQVSTTGTLPGGLSANIDYYVIKLDENVIALAQSPEAVEAGQKIDILDAGSGTHTVQNYTNWELLGLERKSLFFYGANPGKWNRNIYVETIHYPYGDSSTWSQDAQAAADLIKEPDCFFVYVYQKNPDNSITLVEDPFLCSRIKGKKDGYGNNVYVEDALLKSYYIRAKDNDSVDPSIYPKNQASILMLYGGDDGNQVTDSQMLVALNPLKSRRNIFFTLLLDGGWATPAYQKQGLLAIAENRRDAFAILSCPISSEQSSDYINSILSYRKTELNADSSFGGLFTSHLKIRDTYNDRTIYVPPDGYVGAVISETAANYELWYPPAGARRGVLDVLDVVRRFTEGEENILYDNGINPIDFYPGKGIRVWGQKTLLSKPRSDDRINVRLMLIVIEPAIAEFLETYVFEFNDTLNRTLAASGIETYMENIRSRNGVYDYKVVCSSDNNSAADEDANRMNAWLFVKPVKASEFIKFTTILTPTGGSFTVG